MHTFDSSIYPFYSHPVGSNDRNSIIAVTPMKFLPIIEFEQRQKSINKNQNRAITSSILTKFWFWLNVQSCFIVKITFLKTTTRHSMSLKTSRRHWNWKKGEMMLSKGKNMKSPRNFILKHFFWTRPQAGIHGSCQYYAIFCSVQSAGLKILLVQADQVFRQWNPGLKTTLDQQSNLSKYHEET